MEKIKNELYQLNAYKNILETIKEEYPSIDMKHVNQKINEKKSSGNNSNKNKSNKNNQIRQFK